MTVLDEEVVSILGVVLEARKLEAENGLPIFVPETKPRNEI